MKMLLFAFSTIKTIAAHNFSPINGAYNANCSTNDYDKMVICQSNLIEVADKCYESCHDGYCQLNCSEIFYESLDECPCYSKCHNGCSGCDNWTCGNACKDPSFPEASKCREKLVRDLLKCQNNCGNDFACITRCGREMAVKEKKCPCGQFCPDGCPCDSWAGCAARTEDWKLKSEGQLLLLLGNFDDPIMINFDDSWKKLRNFHHTESVSNSFACNALVDGRMMVFGGLPFGPTDYKKISEVKDCGMTEIGHLPHDFYMGLCTTVSMVGNHEAAILCRNQYDITGLNDKKRCFSFDHAGTSLDSRMNYVHADGAMGSIGYTAILVGGREGFEGKAEIELSEFGNWRIVEDYPFGKIYDQSIVTIGDEIIMSGGIGDRGPTKRVSKASLSGHGLKWSIVGDLLYARYKHAMGVREAQAGMEVYFFGGWTHDEDPNINFTDRMEKWTFKSQEETSKEMTDVKVYDKPATQGSAFIVPFDFCF